MFINNNLKYLGGNKMSKKEFVEAYAKATGETKKRAEELVNAFLETYSYKRRLCMSLFL